MKKNNKGSILGLTTVVILVVTILISVVVLIVLTQYSSTVSKSKKKEAQIKIQTIAQEVYVNLKKDIAINNVKDEYDITTYGKVMVEVININSEINYEFDLVLNSIKMHVEVGYNGSLKAWVIL